MKDNLSKLSNYILFLGIYLYFTAWVYIHFYYDSFGLTTMALKIDYSSYLVYSWDVFSNKSFLWHSAIIITIVIIIKKCLNSFEKWFPLRLINWIKDSQFLILVLCMTAIFPYLFFSAKNIALKNYRLDRVDAKYLKSIQFIFRKGDEYLSPAISLDSSAMRSQFCSDMQILKNDSTQQLKLLGESDDNYYVLNQKIRNVDGKINANTGYVYVVQKSDVLLSKIILRSFK